MKKNSVIALALCAVVSISAAAEGKDWYGRQTLQGRGTGWWDKEGFPLAPPLESCRKTASPGWPNWPGGRCTWLVTLEQPAGGPASFELIDLNDDGWRRTPFTVSSGRPWEFEVSDIAEAHYDPKWVLRTDSTEPWTLVFLKKEPGAIYLQGHDFKVTFTAEKYRQPTEDPFDFCEFSLCPDGERFNGKAASWPSRKAAVIWTFDPEKSGGVDQGIGRAEHQRALVVRLGSYLRPLHDDDRSSHERCRAGMGVSHRPRGGVRCHWRVQRSPHPLFPPLPQQA